MEHLKRISTSPDATFYAIDGSSTPVTRYVATTPEIRETCNRPELLGCEYTSMIRSGMTSLLSQAPFRKLIEDYPESRVCVLNFLRGGLNFGLREVLHEAYGLNAHSSAFLSSQRYRVDGRWEVRENMYRKLRIPRGALILTADVVATGTTVASGLRVLFEHLCSIGSSIRGLVFFTIGCDRLERELEIFDKRCRDTFSDYEGTIAVYLEGRFRLLDEAGGVRIGLPGTDLLRHECLLAPELEASQYEWLSFALERCAIYDAGSRAFDIPGFVLDVLDYWHQVAELARQGWTLREALAERWPERDYASYEHFLKTKKQLWRGVTNRELDELYERYRGRWASPFISEAGTTAALAALAAQRIATLEKVLSQ